MAWFRRQFCVPNETANSKCAVPVFTSKIDEGSWCFEYYNSTDCVAIRNSTQARMLPSIYTYYYANVAWTILFVLLVRELVAAFV